MSPAQAAGLHPASVRSQLCSLPRPGLRLASWEWAGATPALPGAEHGTGSGSSKRPGGLAPGQPQARCPAEGVCGEMGSGYRVEAWGAPLAGPVFSAIPPGPPARVAAASSGLKGSLGGSHSPHPHPPRLGRRGRGSRGWPVPDACRWKGGALSRGPAGLTGPQPAGQAETHCSCCQDNHGLSPAQKGLRGGRSAPFPRQAGGGAPFQTLDGGGEPRSTGVYCPGVWRSALVTVPLSTQRGPPARATLGCRARSAAAPKARPQGPTAPPRG